MNNMVTNVYMYGRKAYGVERARRKSRLICLKNARWTKTQRTPDREIAFFFLECCNCRGVCVLEKSPVRVKRVTRYVVTVYPWFDFVALFCHWKYVFSDCICFQTKIKMCTRIFRDRITITTTVLTWVHLSITTQTFLNAFEIVIALMYSYAFAHTELHKNRYTFLRTIRVIRNRVTVLTSALSAR